MDQIRINDLSIEASVGVYPWERANKQTIHFDLVLVTDLSTASRSDNLEDALDYVAVEQTVLGIVRSTHFNLIEKLAGDVCEALLTYPEVYAVDIVVTKPNASVNAKSVSVEMSRKR